MVDEPNETLSYVVKSNIIGPDWSGVKRVVVSLCCCYLLHDDVFATFGQHHAATD